ncbi:cytochrome-c oxidase, cbb3-type subunit III [Litoreibacter roseus]|uniref:Cbb3-type cytochrome c oxidase subunit n=1 Tax=Litoreibacter roseus TaxID=2601869 RepID=A0A6N6JES5_9RHOB|nr:cytochrome-c oxidase, cbb3-type subunit III [Litoreibacter roseus]GFE64853.1 Cbb3-type cytochrome c oxidase subunit CcoP [Litoreibacter roseus]
MDHNEKDIDDVTGIDTTGHEWDGIKELNNPLPRWWLWAFYATIVWAVLYTVAYPAWPLVNRATGGLLGYSTRGEVVQQIEAVEAQNATLTAALASVDLASLSEDQMLNRYAIAGGAAVFRTYCSQCHGSGAAGAVGYPNLLDDDWLWGGEIEEIAYTVRHGIRNEVDSDAHWSEMPAFGELLEEQEITNLVEYVRSISGQQHDAAMAAEGTILFEEQCTACHGEAGMGDDSLGAPNLTDAIWLYGGDREALTETITYSRFGVMPPWSPRLSDAEVNAVAAYVHQLGGGEQPATE